MLLSATPGLKLFQSPPASFIIMSTLMSGDMNLTRPSTRVRVAPGGASTITFGDPSTTTVRATPAPTISTAVISPTLEGVR